jgi:hypothetical protein
MIYQTVIATGLLATLGAAVTTDYNGLTSDRLKTLFDNFKKRHNRFYSTMDEESHRYNVFVSNLKLIDERNARETAAGGNAVHGVTRFADLTQQEFADRFLDTQLRNKMKIRSANSTLTTVVPIEGTGAVDYTDKQTTAVKDQGNCGSCWAHAAAQQIESEGMRQFGNPASLELSVQQLVSCDHGEGQLGCMGGLQETAFDYVRENGGIVTAADYPYTEKTGRCDTSKNNYVMGVVGYEMILRDTVAETEADFTSYMLSSTGGTISLGVDATTWSTYISGVMHDCGKGTDINHAVQGVGVDSSSNGWWKIRNSWSPDWGEDGYIRIAYGSNTCGLATEGGSHATVFNI